MRLLLIEDSPALADALLPQLRQAGYIADWIVDGRDADRAVHDQDYDIVVLDLGLPGRSGLDILQDWRSRGLQLPVLILTARDTFAERIAGLRAGADDYLTKPFHPEELLLRLQALLRHRQGLPNAVLLEAGGLALDEQQQQVRLQEQEIALSGSEFRLLRYFMQHPGRLLGKAELEEHLFDAAGELNSNVLEVQVNRLRRKLGRDIIETRRGQGYLFRGLDPAPDA
jgi:two-component system OmpR family response regulator